MKEIICKEEIGGGLFMHTIYEPVQELIRCKDCKHRFNGCCYNKESNRVNFTEHVPDDWYCADGERRKENA